MKKLIILISFLFSASINAASENDLKVMEVGAWTEGNSIFYIKFDRKVGPTKCSSNLTKIYLGDENSSPKQLMAMTNIRAMALTALTAQLKVDITTLDTCLHNSPTFNTLFIKAKD